MKTETLFVCTKCDAQFSKWAGQCTECGAWGTVKEDSGNVRSAESSSRTLTARPGKIQAFTDLT
ncbi:MAG TPA: DNA repair protein RadA, partial [Patescibacteria group bacterium]|nr:DNA repair protein RadA [Patescibacteria group bacterium]